MLILERLLFFGALMVAAVIIGLALFWFICVKLIPAIIDYFWHGGGPRW